MVFYRIPKAVKYVEDMIFSWIILKVNECENLNRKRDINYYGNLGLYFLHTTIVFKSREPNLTSRLSPDAQSGYIIYLNCTE